LTDRDCDGQGHDEGDQMFRLFDRESAGGQKIIVVSEAPDNRGGQGFRPAPHGRKSNDGRHISNATVAWSMLGVHKQPAKSATIKPPESARWKTTRPILPSWGRGGLTTALGDVSCRSGSTAERR
jgi:hypothetical protein